MVMSFIKKLPKELVEKIAAGEVVERPASIVKELVENAIDAGATSLVINLKGGGITSIEIKDNGKGMSSEDLLMAVEAHATSKLSTADDLFALHSLGFRGEALASICAVSKVVIRSKQQQEDTENRAQTDLSTGTLEGYDLRVEGGEKFPLKIVGMNGGTHILITDLFYNVPARRKFLKTQSTELSVILQLLENFILSYPHISFSVTHNDQLVLNSPSGDLIGAVRDIYGNDIAKDAVSLHHEIAGMNLQGVLIKPRQLRSDKKGMSIFVNGRIVKNSELYSAVLEGYDTLLMVGKYPYVVLHLDLDPKQIDVNVHPRKDIIKIDAEKDVLQFICDSINKTLQTTNLLRDMSLDMTKQSSQNSLSTHAHDSSQTHANIQSSGNSSYENISSSSSVTSNIAFEQPQVVYESSSVSMQTQQVFEKTSDIITSEAFASEHASEHLLVSQKVESLQASRVLDAIPIMPSIRYIGLLHKTYGLCEDANGLVLVDFHAAHERYNYEQFMDQFYGKTIRTQELLSPIVIDLPTSEFAIYTQNKDLLASFGFLSEEFGLSQVILRSVPHMLGRLVNAQYFRELLSDIAQNKRLSLDVLQQEIITSMSCKASDKAGDDLSSERVKVLISFALNSTQKYACPHGRPTFIRISYAELEKMFKRRV
jgi:DNA mismatch repair protein MutL